MAEIPDNPVTPATLAEWYTKVAQLAKLKASEMLLRQKIFKHYFKEPKEGANTFVMPDGYQLKGDRVVNRKVDEPLYKSMMDEFIGKGINPHELVRYKPELNTAAYRQLTAEQQNFFDQCLIVTDGSPSLKIAPPAKPKG
jgi:hypothetical protein